MKNSKDISRRNFLEISTQSAVSLGLIPLISSSCSDAQAAKTVNGACCLDCPDSCSWQATVENNKVTDFKASSDNPFTAGKLCDKMANYPTDVTYSPQRLLKPLKRIGRKGGRLVHSCKPLSRKKAGKPFYRLATEVMKAKFNAMQVTTFLPTLVLLNWKETFVVVP